MMPPRQVRGIVVAGLLCTAALAGCASASSGTGYAAGSTAAAVAAAAGGAPAAAAPAAAVPAAAVGCGSVRRATKVTVLRVIRPIEPIRAVTLIKTQRNPGVVRALFGDFCKVVAHPFAVTTPVRCPAALGVGYSGTFYDGSRKLATFMYGASGCQTVNVTATGTSLRSLVMGQAASAAPQLETDMAAVLGLPKNAVFGAPQQVNPGGPDRP